MFEQPHRLHPAAIIIKSGAYLVQSLKAMVPAIIAIFATGGHGSREIIGLTAGLFALMIGGFALVGPLLHYLSTRFYIEADALVISSGFVWRQRRTIPLARIQNVNLERTLWHRILNAASVKIETAAGKRSEGDLAALSIADANSLQSLLLQGRGLSQPEVESARPEPVYSLSTKQVLLAGALGNRVLYIVAGVFSVFQFDRSEALFKPVVGYVERLSPAAAVGMSALILFGLVALGWIVSIAISATRFFGFRIDQHERGLMLTHGLITQFRTIVPVGRIQSVRIVEPIFFRLFGYGEVYADTAGSFDKKDVGLANKVCPLVPEGEVSHVGLHLLPDFEFERLFWRSVSPKTVARHALRYLLVLSILLAWPASHWLGWHALWLSIPLAGYCWILGVVAYRYVGYSFTNDILAARSGIFRKQATIVPFDRIQHYTINSTYAQRVMGLATVTAVSAAAGGHAIHVADMDRSSADRLRQTIAESIQSHLGARRGGL